MKNITKTTNRKAMLMIAFVAAMLLGLRNAEARSNCVFALTDSETESQFSPQKYYYGNYEKGEPKGEPTRAHTEKYAKVTASRSDWSGTYLFVGQNSNTTYWAFTGNSLTYTATNGAVQVTSYSNQTGANNSATRITNPPGVVDMKIELVGNAKNSKGIDYYRISYVQNNTRYYIGCTANTTNTMTTTTTKPTNLTDDAQYLWQIKAGALMTNGTVIIINKKWSSDNLGFRLTSSYKALSNYAGNITVNQSTGWSQIHLYEKMPDYTVTYDANGGTGSMSDGGNPYTSENTVTVLENGFTAPDGKDFLKWNTDSEGNGTDYVPGATFSITGNTTLYAQWTNIHGITIASTTHGTVTTDPYPSINAGMPVDITITPETGYVLESLTVTDEYDNVVALHNRRFIMPDSDVTVTATFRTATGMFIKRTDIDEDSWAGTYRIGFYEGGGGDYAFNATTPSSGNSTGIVATYSANHDTLMTGKIVTIEYGGRWPADLESGNTAYYYRDSSYYFIYFEDASGNKQYLNGGSSGQLTFTTLTSTPTTNTYKWFFYKYYNTGNSKVCFLIRNFYGGCFMKAVNAGSNHHINIGTGTNPSGPSAAWKQVYLYRYDLPTYRINVVGDAENARLNMRSHSVIPDRDGGYTAYADSTVTVKIQPKVGYEVSSVSYVTAGTTHVLSSSTIHATEQKTFNFTMPAETVTLYINTNEEGEDSDCVSEGEYNTSNGKYGASNTSYYPYGIDTKFSYNQFVYSDANLPAKINSIGFMYYVNNTTVHITHKTDVRVYMADTTASTLASFMDTANMTRVYMGSMNFTSPFQNNWEWTDFAFNQNGGYFQHDPEKNLIVLIFDNSNVGDEYTNRGFFYASAGTGNYVHRYATASYGFMYNDSRALYYKNDSGGQGNAVNAGSQSIYYPITHFCGVPTYTVTCATGIENGSISAAPNIGLEGDETVTITATPDEGYTLNTVTATNETTSETITLSGSGNTRTFTMPAANVSVTATFRLAGGGGDTWVDNVTSQPAGYVVDGSGNVTISSAEGLAWLINVVNGGESLSGKTVNLDADLDMYEHIWVPIGYSSTAAFAGTFNGNNHTISNLHIASSEISDVETAAGSAMQYTGLFGYTDGATIKNVVLTSGNELANNNASGSIGSVVGYANNSTIEFCQSEATLTAAGNITAMGGMVGTAASTNVNGVTSLVSMAHGENNVTSVGGVVGTGGTVKTYIANNTITGSGTVTNKSAVANSATVSNGYVLSTNSGYTVASGTGYAPGDYTAVTPYTYGSNSNTVSNVPMVKCLNNGTPATNMAWKQAKGTKINGGYPIIVRTDDAVPMGCVKNGNLLRHDNVNTLLTAAASTDTVFMYGSGAITLSSAPSCKFYIDEDAALTQANDIAINATVGITFDNTAGNGEKSRDWHAFSSALTAASIGISYGGSQVHEYGANNLPLEQATGFSLVQNNAAVYLPNGITVANSCDGTEFDLYAYSEPNYHWVNMKRETGNHFYEDTHEAFSYTNETTYTPGRGYFIAIGDNSTKNYNLLQANGTLNNGSVGPISVTHNGAHLSGYNLLGNPYQSYLDFNEFASVNGSALWGEGVDMGYKAYLIYDADIDGFDEYLVDENGTSFSQGSLKTASRYIHPHQGFFVLKKEGEARDINFTNAMRVTNNASAYRDAQPSYPLVNLVCTDSEGKQEITVIEFERPATAGSLKMKGMLNSKGNLYIHYNNEDFGSMFLNDMPEMLPLWFRALEDGVFTLSWSTANGVFSNLHLIDNLTGADIDCNAAQSYTFESRQSDSKARFRLVFTPYGIEEETAEGESFAFISNGELIVTGNGELSLIDLNGRVLTTEHIAGEQSRISVPAVAEGMYLLRLTSNKGVRMQKIVVRR